MMAELVLMWMESMIRKGLFRSETAEIAASTALKKVCRLHTQKPDSLIALEYQIQQIEKDLVTRLRTYIFDVEREIVYDFEDLIEELLILTEQRKNRDAFISYISAFIDLPKQVFFVLVVVDLLHHYKLRQSLEQIISELHRCRLAGPSFRIHCESKWQISFSELNLSLCSTIISPVISKFEALLTFQKQLSLSLRKQARWLRDEFASLQVSLQDAESKELSEEAMAFIEELCDVCRAAENSVGLFIMDMQGLGLIKGKVSLKNLVWTPHNFVSQRVLSKQMSLIKDKIGSLDPKILEQAQSSSFRLQPQRQPPPCSSIPDQLDTLSFDEDIDAITALLLKDGHPRVSKILIVGVGGIGKTCLAKLIYDSQAVEDRFPYPHRIWLSKPTEQDIKKREALFRDKRNLIVIDDPCCNISWHILQGLDISARVIVTARHLEKSRHRDDTVFTYRLHLRNDEQSWVLFTHTLKMEIPPKLEENLKKEMLSKCGGLPKVIVKLGELLSQATLDQWPKVLEQLIQDQEPWSEVLQKINKDIPLYLRKCLFCFGLFPLGYKIPARRLIALWIAEGLRSQKHDARSRKYVAEMCLSQKHDASEKHDTRSPEYVAEMCLRELINCNMVQLTENKRGDKIKKCRLPEALWLHWFSKAKETNSRIGLTRYLTDQNDSIFDRIHGRSPITSFLSFNTREGAGQDILYFLDQGIASNCFRFLWVLDLEKVYQPKFPKAADQLTHLRYLGLRWTYLEEFPGFINKLLSLQRIDLKRTHINTLPPEIWMMQELRHLFLDENFCSMFVLPQEDNFLLDLQTFRGVCIDENTPVRNGLDKLLNIRKLGIKCRSLSSQKAGMSEKLNDVANWVRNLKHLQYLKLKSFDEKSQPWDLHIESLSAHVDLSNVYLVGKLKKQHIISELPKNLIELTLSASGLEEDPMQILAKLPNLQILRLFSKSFTGKKMLCSYGGFPMLEVLKFWELELLEVWNVEVGALPSLTDLEIRRCGNLKMIPDGLRHIKTLREIKVTRNPVLSSRMEDKQGADWNKIAHVPRVYIEH